MEIGPEQTRTDHGKRCARIQWFDGYETIEEANDRVSASRDAMGRSDKVRRWQAGL